MIYRIGNRPLSRTEVKRLREMAAAVARVMVSAGIGNCFHEEDIRERYPVFALPKADQWLYNLIFSCGISEGLWRKFHVKMRWEYRVIDPWRFVTPAQK